MGSGGRWESATTPRHRSGYSHGRPYGRHSLPNSVFSVYKRHTIDYTNMHYRMSSRDVSSLNADSAGYNVTTRASGPSVWGRNGDVRP